MMRDPRAIDPGWTRLSAPGDKCFARWKHSSGWMIEHCGHPTANWPYVLRGPRRSWLIVVSCGGRGFKNLISASRAVALILSGSAIVTSKDCEPGIAYTPEVSAFGDLL